MFIVSVTYEGFDFEGFEDFDILNRYKVFIIKVWSTYKSYEMIPAIIKLITYRDSYKSSYFYFFYFKFLKFSKLLYNEL